MPIQCLKPFLCNGVLAHPGHILSGAQEEQVGGHKAQLIQEGLAMVIESAGERVLPPAIESPEHAEAHEPEPQPEPVAKPVDVKIHFPKKGKKGR